MSADDRLRVIHDQTSQTATLLIGAHGDAF